jgi:DNA-binding response OmpR family regulator
MTQLQTESPASATDAHLALNREPAHVATDGLKILVVDDEPDFLLAVTMRLQSSGYEVVSALNAKLGMIIAKIAKPDLILLDIGLPDQSGHELARQLTCNLATFAVPLIYVTGRRDTFHRVEAMKSGAVDYIVKPFTTARLLTAIESALTF